MELKEREEIQARYPNVKFPDPVMEPVWAGKRPTERLDGRFAVMDQNTNIFYAFATDQYQIIHYEEILKLVETAVKEMPEFGPPEIKPTMLAEGGKMRIATTFTDVKYEIRKDDFVNPKVEVFTSYDLGWKYRMRFGAYRIICSNGAMVGKIFNSFAKRHLVSLNPKELSDNISVGMTKYSDQVGLWKKWAQKIIGKEQYDESWKTLPFSTAEREKIEKLPETQTRLLLPDALSKNELTLWDFFNVTTQFASHEVGSELRKIDLEEDITRAMETLQ